jgi:hypothetical protein
MNVHTQTKDETDCRKESFNEEQGRLFNQFLKKTVKYLLGIFNEKAGREVFL